MYRQRLGVVTDTEYITLTPGVTPPPNGQPPPPPDSKWGILAIIAGIALVAAFGKKRKKRP